MHGFIALNSPTILGDQCVALALHLHDTAVEHNATGFRDHHFLWCRERIAAAGIIESAQLEMLQRGVLRGRVVRPNLFNEPSGAEYVPLVAAQHDGGDTLEMGPLDDGAPRAWITQHLIHGPIRA